MDTSISCQFGFFIFIISLLILTYASQAGGNRYDPFEPYQGSLIAGQKTCPGLYCGRVKQLNSTSNESYGPCGACPRGERRNSESICERCTIKPPLYDWLYIGFMVLLSIGLHSFFIDFFSKGQNVLLLHGSAVVECVLATIVTLLMMEPKGHLAYYSCGVQRLSDWYTMLNNPTPEYTTTLHCTQEAVHPLYTTVFVIYTLELLLLMLFRPILSVKFCKNRGRNSIYAALYFLPLLVLLHALCAGLIYYSFSLVLVIVSLVTHAVHFAYSEIESPSTLLSSKRDLVILLGHWVCHSYGIISLTRLANPATNLPLLALVLLPVVFYIATEQFTEPTRIQSCEV